MKALIQKRLKNQRGLTLIELLVVIVILGIIAAIAVPMVMGNQDKANKNTNAQNLQIYQDAVNRYYIDNAPLESSPGTTVPSGLVPTYINSIPKAKGCATDFVFTGNTTSATVSLAAGCLPD